MQSLPATFLAVSEQGKLLCNVVAGWPESVVFQAPVLAVHIPVCDGAWIGERFQGQKFLKYGCELNFDFDHDFHASRVRGGLSSTAVRMRSAFDLGKWGMDGMEAQVGSGFLAGACLLTYIYIIDIRNQSSIVPLVP